MMWITFYVNWLILVVATVQLLLLFYSLYFIEPKLYLNEYCRDYVKLFYSTQYFTLPKRKLHYLMNKRFISYTIFVFEQVLNIL